MGRVVERACVSVDASSAEEKVARQVALPVSQARGCVDLSPRPSTIASMVSRAALAPRRRRGGYAWARPQQARFFGWGPERDVWLACKTPGCSWPAIAPSRSPDRLLFCGWWALKGSYACPRLVSVPSTVVDPRVHSGTSPRREMSVVVQWMADDEASARALATEREGASRPARSRRVLLKCPPVWLGGVDLTSAM